MNLPIPWKRKNIEADLDDEIRFHFDHQVEQNVRSGMSRQEALRQARIAFGGMEQVKEACRDERAVRWADVLLQDVRYGARMLRKQPAFTAAAVLILALGIGANTAIFSVVDAVLLKPLPFKDPNRLVVLTEDNAAKKVGRTGASFPDYRAWAQQTHTLEQLAAYWNVSGDGLVFGGSSSPERVQYSIVTQNFLSILGISPSLGRAFDESDENPGARKVFLASDALWKRNMGASRDAIGKSFSLDGESYTLLGVLPPAFTFPQHCDVLVPLGVLTSRQLADRVSHPFWGLGRLRPDSNIRRAQSELDLIASQLSAAYPSTGVNWTVRVTPLIDEFAGNIRQSLLVLLGAVLFILLIACASVANLMLARSEVRQKEFAMRAALGAGRGRLICQTLIESLLIASISTVLALFAGSWGLQIIAAVASNSIAGLEHFHLDVSMLVFAGALTVATTLLIGLSPALQFSAVRFQESLREGSRGGVSPRSQRLRNLLVIAEVSITLVLLSGAGLMLGSFERLRRVDPGFNPHGVVTMRLALPDALYTKTQQRKQFLDRVLEQVQQLPGVEAVGAVNTLPLTGATNWETIRIADSPALDWAAAPSVELRNVSAAYFRAIGIRLTRGRDFLRDDPGDQARAVVINQCMADRFWPGADPIGKRLSTIDAPQQWREVVGVVANVKHFGLNAENDPEMYLPSAYWSSMNLVVRTSADPATLIPAIRAQVSALDKGVPVYDATSMDEVISRSVVSQRLDSTLLVCFATLALLLSAAGIYGLLVFGVNCRQREIGLRMALGAAPARILRLVIWSGMKLVLAGLALGALASFALTRAMNGLLFQISATDPIIFAAVMLLLACIAMLACWLPGRRAMRLDPMTALRLE